MKQNYPLRFSLDALQRAIELGIRIRDDRKLLRLTIIRCNDVLKKLFQVEIIFREDTFRSKVTSKLISFKLRLRSSNETGSMADLKKAYFKNSEDFFATTCHHHHHHFSILVPRR